MFFTALFGGQLLSDDMMAEMTTGRDGYGLGIGVDWPEFGENVLGHGGDMMGFKTLALHSPDTGRTGFVVATSDDIDVGQALDSVLPLLEAETLEDAIVAG